MKEEIIPSFQFSKFNVYKDYDKKELIHFYEKYGIETGIGFRENGW